MLENLKLLRDDMKEKDWTICSFIFTFKENEFVVLVKRFLEKEKKENEYALAKLHFIKSCNLNDELFCEANSYRIFLQPKKLREYFGIEYSENIGNVLKQFYNYLGKFIPKNMNTNVSEKEKNAMVKSLNTSGREELNKIYCTNVMRNAIGKKRTLFNADKTKLLRPELFEKFKDDKSISFCFSTEKEDEKDDLYIIKNFSEKIK